jgi:hypothetical protein
MTAPCSDAETPDKVEAMGANIPTEQIEAFIARWQGREGGQERANYALFLSELCDVLGVKRPDPAAATTEENDYVFERVVKGYNPDGSASSRRMDLYKRGCFVLEAKQSRLKGGAKEIAGQTPQSHSRTDHPRGTRTASRAWDVLMLNARRQAEAYARALPVSHGWPPFILVCDVGHVIEVYADFSGQGKNYAQFPDRQGFRVYLEDLRQPEIRERLIAIWTAPMSLDPARASARVTRQIAERLAAVSKALELRKIAPEQVAMFLMRCLFTMFAEDVNLLPEDSFTNVLKRCEEDPTRFAPMVGQLWEAMDKGEFAYALEMKVKRFNGEFFRSKGVLSLGKEEIADLREAASYRWQDVDPSIFGTLLEQALDENERRRLGAHYTPRAYVERLVVATILEPLREEWGQVMSTAERQKSERRADDAIATVKAFHEKLCQTRVLDPACGTGNFLYVSLELLKRLEGEVLEALADLGGQEALIGLEGHTIDPHQFLGMELNPRAAAIAELVLWIGHLQWHIRTKGGLPSEPILRAFKNVVVKDAVLEADTALVRGDDGKPKTRTAFDGSTVEVVAYENPRQPEWPVAEFIVGNPPFIGGKDIRVRQGDNYTEALWAAHPDMNDSADYVMYWWDRAAELLVRKKTALRRFGFVTTNSITQVFQRRVVERHLSGKKPMSLVMAIPDHPWTKAAADTAAVRIAMTVGAAGKHDGLLREVSREEALDTDTPHIEFKETRGTINSDLTVGVDITSTTPLMANEGISSPGVKLHGSGFIVNRSEAEGLGLGKRTDLAKHIREYRNGRDLAARARGVMVIDLFGLTAEDVRKRYPEVYQHVLTTVKPERDANNRATYRDQWWIFGEPRRELRPALAGLSRYIATVETTKHRVFQFLDATILPDNMIVAIASDDAFHLGVLSSRAHVSWSLRSGGWLGVGNDPRYSKSRCFDPFPFPNAAADQKRRIREIAEELDHHRKNVLSTHENLTLTGLYNVQEQLRAGVQPNALTPQDRVIFDNGLVMVMKELHDRLDAAVADAYGWPANLTEDEILNRLVKLNRERANEEARGKVRWVRPEYQIERFGTAKEKAELDLAGGEMHAAEPTAGPKPTFPADDTAQTASVMAVLAGATAPIEPDAICTKFKQGRKVLAKVTAVLAALTRTGYVDTRDHGKTFALRRVA